MFHGLWQMWYFRCSIDIKFDESLILPRWSDGTILGRDHFLPKNSMELEDWCLISKKCPEHWVGDRTSWLCFNLGLTTWLVLSSVGELDFTASALTWTTRGPHSSLLWVTKCLCALHTPAREDRRSFLDDNGRSTVQDEGRLCDVTTTRVRAVFLCQFLWWSLSEEEENILQ